ncbi:hypothetical protein NE237_023016 [Protea cynaroides]|uniref:BHLH domain-containing protein n=1 Tax=Protea cynaroides TaxID=273540 RepID=A0A9Q0K511_9MAGN|nr:hypothetical protein NE237_023016 [Protea cynaroides]
MSPPLDLGLDNAFPAYANPLSQMASVNGALPVPGFAFPEPSHLKMAQATEPQGQGWFYCLPRHRQAAFAPTDCVGKEKFSAFPHGFYGPGAAGPNAGLGSVQKRFLVCDHSGNQTSFFISSVIAPIVQLQHPSYKIENPFDANGLRDPIYQSGPVVSDRLDENHENDDGSEMREDTEELNALLYSDDEFEDTDGGEEDDEVASTGHSPYEMGHEKQEEEIASSGGLAKRRKLLNGEHQASSSVMDTASSAKPNGLSSEYEDDAQSSCIKGRTGGRELGSSKRSRKERIQETVSILQSIIPGGKGKDAALVLDEAIQYLTSLKVKAKSLGTSITLK